MNRQTKLSFIGITSILVLFSVVSFPALISNIPPPSPYHLQIEEGDTFAFELIEVNESLFYECYNTTYKNILGDDAEIGKIFVREISNITERIFTLERGKAKGWFIGISYWRAWVNSTEELSSINASYVRFPLLGNGADYGRLGRPYYFQFTGVPTPTTDYLSSINWTKSIEHKNTELVFNSTISLTNMTLAHSYTFDQDDGYLSHYSCRSIELNSTLYTYTRHELN
jgi:hypothetical protein